MKPPRSSAVLRLLAGLAIVTILLALLPRDRVWGAIRGVPLRLWLAVLACYLAVHCLGALKFRMMVNLGGAGLSRAQAVQCYFGGLFGTLFLPSIVGGEVVRAGVGLRLARHRAGFLLGSLMDRVMDVSALAIISATGALLLPGELDARSRRIFFLLAAAAMGMAAATVAVVALLPARRFPFKLRRILVRLREAAQSLAGKPRVLLLSLLGSIVVQSSIITLGSVLAGACGLNLRLRVWMFAWPLAKLAGLLPVSQGGLGVREAALAALLLPFGAPAALTVAAGLLWQTIIHTNGLLSALIVLVARRVERLGPAAVAAVPQELSERVAQPR